MSEMQLKSLRHFPVAAVTSSADKNLCHGHSLTINVTMNAFKKRKTNKTLSGQDVASNSSHP